jgi:hypothetical protein
LLRRCQRIAKGLPTRIGGVGRNIQSDKEAWTLPPAIESDDNGSAVDSLGVLFAICYLLLAI